MYGPALALETVTGLDRWTAVWVSGAVCIFYTSIGGLKAVVWTDTLQILLMFAGFLSIIVDGAINFGGFSEIIKRADEGGRLIWNDFSGDVTRRHSFWSIVFGGTFGIWGAFFCVTQSYTQRMMACKSRRDMRIAVYGGYVGIAIILIFAMLTGFVAYASYQCCDPINAGWISSRDQLIPYLAVDRFKNTPGAASLFVIGKITATIMHFWATNGELKFKICLKFYKNIIFYYPIKGAYGGTLSTVSSGINSMATVFISDFVKPIENKIKFFNPTERNYTILVKVKTFLF